MRHTPESKITPLREACLETPREVLLDSTVRPEINIINQCEDIGFECVLCSGVEVDSEEAVLPFARRKPEEPTKEERRIHKITHLPFRSWCPHCVKARAKNWPHYKQREEKKSEKALVTFAVDYCLMRDEKDQKR